MKKNVSYRYIIECLLEKKNLYFFALLFSLISIIVSILSPLLFSKLIDYGILASNKKAIIELILITMVLTIIGSISCHAMNILFGKIRKCFVLTVKKRVVHKLALLNGEELSKLSNGYTLNILDKDIEEIGFTMTERVFYIIFDSINALVSLTVMLFINVKLTIISIFIQGILIFINKSLTKKIRALNDEMRVASDELLNVEEEFTRSLIEIIQSDISSYFKKCIDKKESLRQDKIYDTNRFESANISISSFMDFVAMASIWLIGGFSVIDGFITYGILTAYSSYSAKLWAPILRLMSAFVDIQKLKLSISRVSDLLNLPELDGNKCDIITPFHSDIVFKDVGFSYEPNKKILNQNSFVIKNKSINILIGKSGQGKSTLTYLLTNLWNVSEGKILLWDENIIEYKNDILRKDISYISQNPLLYNDTLRNNLCPDIEIADDEIYNALGNVNLLDFVMSQEQGLDYIIDSGGNNLSGGERQRISIARALLRKSNLYIFDEPTSNLDPFNKDIIFRIISEILVEKTIILITHDYSVLTKYNEANIYLVNNGIITQVNSDKISCMEDYL